MIFLKTTANAPIWKREKQTDIAPLLKKNTKNTITNIVKMSQFKILQNWNRNVDDV